MTAGGGGFCGDPFVYYCAIMGSISTFTLNELSIDPKIDYISSISKLNLDEAEAECMRTIFSPAFMLI